MSQKHQSHQRDDVSSGGLFDLDMPWQFLLVEIQGYIGIQSTFVVHEILLIHLHWLTWSVATLNDWRHAQSLSILCLVLLLTGKFLCAMRMTWACQTHAWIFCTVFKCPIKVSRDWTLFLLFESQWLDCYAILLARERKKYLCLFYQLLQVKLWPCCSKWLGDSKRNWLPACRFKLQRSN